MKTSVDIPDREMDELMRLTGAPTKREAIVTAVRAFNRKRRLHALLETFGTWDMDTNEAIESADIEDAARGMDRK